MFKKTLVASAIALVAFGSQAATNTIATAVVSLEGSAGAASIAVPNSVVEVGAEYTVGDTVTFTIAGAEFDTALSTPTLTGALLGSDGAVGGAGDAVDDSVTFGLLNATATTVTFRITAQTDGGTDGITYTDSLGGAYENADFTLSGMVMKTATVLDAVGDIELAYSALTSTSLVIDAATTNTADAATVTAQFSSSVSQELNGVIDVENDRQQFTDNTANDGDDELTDTLLVEIAEVAAAVNDAVYTGATITIAGDFSWMDADGEDSVDATELSDAFAATGADTYTSVINDDADLITVTVADAAGNTVEDATLTFTVAGVADDSAVLSVQDFAVSTVVKYNSAAPMSAASTKAALTDADAGSWTLNGAQALYSYVPLGFAGVQSTMVLSNKGIKDGTVTVEGFDEAGETYGPVSVGTLLRNTNMSITGAAAAAALGVPSRTKVSVTVTVNAPDSDVTFSGYTQKAGTGRQIMAVRDL